MSVTRGNLAKYWLVEISGEFEPSDAYCVLDYILWVYVKEDKTTLLFCIASKRVWDAFIRKLFGDPVGVEVVKKNNGGYKEVMKRLMCAGEYREYGVKPDKVVPTDCNIINKKIQEYYEKQQAVIQLEKALAVAQPFTQKRARAEEEDEYYQKHGRYREEVVKIPCLRGGAWNSDYSVTNKNQS